MSFFSSPRRRLIDLIDNLISRSAVGESYPCTVPYTAGSAELCPRRVHTTDMGADLMNGAGRRIVILPGKTARIGTGVRMAIPAGYGGYLHVRSSLGAKHGLVLANSTGVIDADYRGEIISVVRNIGEKTVIIEPGERFCQIVIHKLPKVVFSRQSSPLSATRRGESGFGSTGRK